MKLPMSALSGCPESRKAHSSRSRCSLELSCSTIAYTSDVSSSHTRCGYLEGGGGGGVCVCVCVCVCVSHNTHSCINCTSMYYVHVLCNRNVFCSI